RASPVIAVALAARISSRTKFPAARRATNNLAKSSRTTQPVVFQLPRDPATCRDIGVFADSARPTTPLPVNHCPVRAIDTDLPRTMIDRKSTRLNSSHVAISYAVFCLKKKKNRANPGPPEPQGARRPDDIGDAVEYAHED